MGRLIELSHEQSDETTHRFVLGVPADLPVFADHFPTLPVLPAYAQLAEVVRYIQYAWPELGAWQGAVNIKFPAPIRPGCEAELQVQRAAGSGRVKFTLTVAGAACASGTLTFATGSTDSA